MIYLMFRTPSPTDRLGPAGPLQSKMGAELRVCQGCNCVFRSLYHRGMISPGTLVLLSAFPTPREAPLLSYARDDEDWEAASVVSNAASVAEVATVSHAERFVASGFKLSDFKTTLGSRVADNVE